VSPTVVDYLDHTQLPDDVLIARPPDETGEDAAGAGPTVDFSGELLPRHTVGVGGWLDLDALSSNRGVLDVECLDSYHIIFSVTRASSGNMGTDVNVQAGRNQQEGDLFNSTASFQPVVPDGPHAVFGVLGQNELFINQDESHLVPTAGPNDAVLAEDYDELNGFDFHKFDANEDGALDVPLYYSVSFATDPFVGSIIFCLPEGWDTAPEDPFETAPVYAPPPALFLQTEDEVDALVVFDADADGVFNEGDAVLLSLRAGSISLGAGWPYSIGSPADVFLVYRDADGSHLSVLAAADQLGLGDTFDDIDALEVILVPDPAVGDADGDCDVDLPDYGVFEMCLYGPGVPLTGVCTLMDADQDSDVDLADFAAFQEAFTGG
jgi:hypothetical protein